MVGNLKSLLFKYITVHLHRSLQLQINRPYLCAPVVVEERYKKLYDICRLTEFFSVGFMKSISQYFRSFDFTDYDS